MQRAVTYGDHRFACHASRKGNHAVRWRKEFFAFLHVESIPRCLKALFSGAWYRFIMLASDTGQRMSALHSPLEYDVVFDVRSLRWPYHHAADDQRRDRGDQAGDDRPSALPLAIVAQCRIGIGIVGFYAGIPVRSVAPLPFLPA